MKNLKKRAVKRKILLDNLTGGSFEFSYFGQPITFELVPV